MISQVVCLAKNSKYLIINRLSSTNYWMFFNKNYYFSEVYQGLVKNYTVRKYQPSDYALWNDFISQAKNATFLFHRDFMEYHADRFEDFSLLVFEADRLIAVLPANIKNDEVHSHEGLTYGGLVTDKKNKTVETFAAVDAILEFLKNHQVKWLFLKMLPSFYESGGNQETDYFLYQKGAVLHRKDLNLAMNLKEPLSVSKSKMKHFRKMSLQGLSYVQTTDLASFWNQVLIPCLAERYKANPVHSLQEIEKLHSLFPENIKHFSVFYKDEIVAGITIFETERVVKSQYGATTATGRDFRALDYLFINLFEHYQKQGKSFFDMGTVNQNEGRIVNLGLLNQKEELGCSVYNQDFYKLAL